MSPEIDAGTLVDGRYKILSRLGTGGMADVFLAEDQQLGRKVALKLLHRRFAEDPGFVERFRREAQSAAGLQHPNVVSVYDRGSYDGTYYIAMEYLPGRTLKQLIREEAPLDPVRAIDITIQILKAARFAHRRGVIHRDLKPHNVIIDESDHAKVTDFGIARAGASDMTETGSIMGTAQYLSPEQAQGHAVSASSDLYSIGVVLYELVTGRVPFDADAAVTIALKHVSEAPTPVRLLNPNVPHELEQVVMWSLNKNPADRPKDADEFVAALEQAKAAIVAGGAGQRTASIAALGAGSAAAWGSEPVRATSYATDLEPAPIQWTHDGDGADGGQTTIPPEPERRPRRIWPWVVLVALLILAGAGAAAYVLTRANQVIVPAVVGDEEGTARTVILNAGFGINVLTQPDTKPAQTVIFQSPDGGAKADKGSIVTITVSTGPGDGTVPSVQGVALAKAERDIRASKLTIGNVLQRPSNVYKAGVVINTSPGAGAALPVGSQVQIIVSTGPPLILIPNVSGESESNAKAALQHAGFTYITTSKQTTTAAPPGDVIAMTPTPGTKATASTTIGLVIARAPTTAAVPNVVGDTAAAARSALRAAGFQVAETTQSVRKMDRSGIVISQSPRANKTVPKKSTVTIVVGHYKAPPPPTTSTTTTTPPPTTTTSTTSTTTTPATTTSSTHT
jgi:serine/threonine-protein kinase